MRFLLWLIAVGALVSTGHAVYAHDRSTALVLAAVTTLLGIAATVADRKAAR